MLGDKSDRLRVTTEQWSTMGDDDEYSSIRSSKSKIDSGGTDEKVESRSQEDKWNLEGMGIRTVM